MQRLLCTIGFTGKTAEEFFTLLSDAGVRQGIDIRQNRTGQLSGFAKHPDLSFFLKTIPGIEYLHEPLLAPPPELLNSYPRTEARPAYHPHPPARARAERSTPPIVVPSSARGHPQAFIGALPLRAIAWRRRLRDTQLPEIFGGVRRRNRFAPSTRGARLLLARALWLQDPRK